MSNVKFLGGTAEVDRIIAYEHIDSMRQEHQVLMESEEANPNFTVESLSSDSFKIILYDGHGNEVDGRVITTLRG